MESEKGTQYKSAALEGLRSGMLAMLILFGIGLVISIFMNLFFLDDINILLNGSLSESPKVSGNSILLIASVIMNLSLLNNGGQMANGGALHIGYVAFLLLPMLSIFIADLRSNHKRELNRSSWISYAVSSLSFTLLVYFFSLIAKGELMMIEVDYTNPMNLPMMLVISMFIQVIIGINMKKDFSEGIRMLRFSLRVLYAIAAIVVLLGGFLLLKDRISNPLYILILLVVLLPNLAVYGVFTIMGASISYGDNLKTLFSQLGIDLSFTQIPLLLRIVLMTIFVIIILFSVWKIKKNYIMNLCVFAVGFSITSLILAYATKINLGIVKNLLDIEFGYSYFYVFFVPLGMILLLGMVNQLIQLIAKEMKES